MMIKRNKIIRLLFCPATALMKRLSLTARYVLLSLLLSIAVAVMLHSLYESLDHIIDTSYMELEGIALIKPLSKTVQAAQQHRGLSAAVLGGTESLIGRLAEKEKETVDAFDAAQKALPTSLTTDANWQSIKTDWNHILEQGLNLAVSDNFEAHTQLVANLLALEGAIADQYKLSLDSDIDSYYLIDTAIIKMQLALEHLGQIRAYGTGVLAKKQATMVQKAKFNMLIGALNNALIPLRSNLDKTGRYNPTLQEALVVTAASFSESSQEIIDQVNSNILNDRFAVVPEDFFSNATTAINGGYAQIYQAMLPQLEALLKARIVRAEKVLYLTIGVALLMFLGVIYSIIGSYIVSIDAIRSLAHSARIIASGDLHERVNLDTRNELKQVGDSFNAMAEGFRQLLEKLQESERRFRTMADSSPMLIWMSDTNKLCDYFNVGWLEFTGRPLEQELGNGWTDGIHPDDYRHCFDTYITAFDQRTSFSMEYRLRRYDGTYRWLIDVGVPRFADDKTFLGYIGSCVDITERKQVEDKLSRAHAELQQFTHIAAHHLQEPARRLVSFVQRLQTQMSVEQLNDDATASLQFIEQAAVRQSALVRDIQLYLAADQPRSTIKKIAVAEIIAKLLEQRVPLIHETAAEVDYHDACPVYIDAPRLKDIFGILLDNALQYRHPERTPDIRIRGGLKDGRAVYSVADNGIGIPPEYRERVFGVFERLQVNIEQDSTGIGLAIVRRIVESCGGSIALQETPGGGTTVLFDLPG